MCVFNVTSALVLASIPCESAVVDQIACQQLGLEYQAVQHETLRNPTAMAYLVTTNNAAATTSAISENETIF